MTDLVQLTYWDETTQTEKDCYPVVAQQSTRNVGEIITSSLPLTDAGLHLLDGTRLSGDGIYGEFVQYIADLYEENPTANYFTDETSWQTAVTQYGVCGKFVYDSTNNTVRLPKITGIIEGTTDVNALGDLVEAGLPNITGEVQPHYDYWRMGTWEGYNNFTTPGTAAWGSGAFGNSTNTGGISFDASRSNSIYGNSTTVQPQTIKCFVYIVIASATKTDIQVDIDNVATDLNGKADVDLTNVPASKGILIESYRNGTSWYRVYSDGWCEQGGFQTSSGVQYYLKPFKDNNYTLLSKGQGTITSTGSPAGTSIRQNYTQTISSYDSTSFTTNFDNNWKMWWQASGYIR